MVDSSEIPDAIQWSEGMLLGPHHFQQATRRSDALLHYRLGRVVPYYWGVSQLKIDPARLSGGVVSVLSLEAIMPDGDVVSHPGTDADSLQLDLSPFAARLQDGSLKIYLVVPALRGDASLLSGQLARYRSFEGAAVVDENTGENRTVVPRLRSRLALHAGDLPNQAFTNLPLAEVTQRNGAFELTGYVPPLLNVSPQSAIAERCRDLVRSVRAKAAFIADRLHAPGAEMRQATIIELRHSLHSLVASLPSFEAVLTTGSTPPFEVYLTLSRLVGHLALLGAGVVPPQFDAYNHDDVAASFAPLLSFAHRMLESVSETHLPVAFTYENAAFQLLMEPAWLRSDLLIGVRARPRQSEQEVNTWINEAVIASSDRVGPASDTRVRGAARRQLTAEEDLEFLPSRGTFVFRIAADPNFIAPRQVLQIVNFSDRAGERRPIEIVLHVPTAREGAADRAGFGPEAEL